MTPAVIFVVLHIGARLTVEILYDGLMLGLLWNCCMLCVLGLLLKCCINLYGLISVYCGNVDRLVWALL